MTGAAAQDPQAALHRALTRLATRIDPAARGIDGLQRLSGGASQETWAFAIAGGREDALILRRAPDGDRAGGSGIGLAAEAQVIARAVAAGVPAPRILHELTPEDGAGRGFVMPRIAGETLPARIFRRDDFAPARAGFARQAGAILAAIHQVDPGGLPLPTVTPRGAVADLRARHGAHGDPRPVFSLALRWLDDHAPTPGVPRLVHGDFRMGNLMIGPEGVRAVLDWELAHAGDPHADLGWLCMESWRFGRPDPVGGLGSRRDLFAAYEAASGTPVDPAAAHWWEVLSALRWGVICEEMGAWTRSGADMSVERHVIARRASETEATLLLNLLEGAP